MSQFMQDSEQYYFTVRDTFKVAHRILSASKELPENKAFVKDFNDMGELFCAMENAIVANPDSTGNITSAQEVKMPPFGGFLLIFFRVLSII